MLLNSAQRHHADFDGALRVVVPSLNPLSPAMKASSMCGTGWGLCPEHQRLSDDGFVALVECNPQRSGASAGAARMKPEQAHRAGRLAHLKREAFAQVFNVPIEATQPCVFVEPGVIEQLQTMVEPAAH